MAERVATLRAHFGREVGITGPLAKCANPADGRSNLLSLTPRGRRLLDRLIPEVRAVNDLFFEGLDRKGYACARRLIARLLADSAQALQRIARSRT